MKGILLAAMAAVAMSGQLPRDMPARATGTATIAGIVTTDATPAPPLRRALVTLSGAELRGDVQVMTDDSGKFAFPGLPAGRYTLTAEKPAYVKTYYGGNRPGRPPGTPIALADGQRFPDLVIKLLRGAVITGTMTDQNGAPIASGQVTALQPIYVDGQRKFVNAIGPLPWAVTDERGRYRLYGLPPGDYTISASGGGTGTEITAGDIEAAMREIQMAASVPALGDVPQAKDERAPRQVTRASQYFPGVTEPSAAEVFALRVSEERTGVDIRSPLVPSARIEGMSVGPGGQPMQNVSISMVNMSRRSLWASPGFVRPDADGRLSMAGLPPGQYRLIGRGVEGDGSPTGAPTAMPLWAEVDFSVDGIDISGVVLQFAPGASVSGRVLFQGSQPPPDSTKVRVSITPVDVIADSMPAAQPAATPSADGTFSLTGVAPGKYRVTASGASAWALRSALLNGRDTLDMPFEVAAGRDVGGLNVAFTDQPTEIAGTLFDRLGRPTPEYSVLVFSTDRTQWTSAPRRVSGAVKLGSDGRYKVSGLPPGEYYVCAIVDIDPRQLTDPSVLESLIPASIKLVLSEGERKTQDLRLAGVR